MSWVLPVGIDYADGTTSLPGQPYGTGSPAIVGTPLPTAQLQWWTSGGFETNFVEEMPGSPSLERAEQCTCQHIVKMPYAEGLSYWTQMARGTIVNDTSANVWRILSCEIKRIEVNFCELTYVMEAISFDSPPDEFELNEVSLDLDITKHPRYSWALSPYVTDASTYIQIGDSSYSRVYFSDIKQQILRGIETYRNAPVYPNANLIQGYIQQNIVDQMNNGKIQFMVPNPNYIQASNVTTIAQPVTWDGNASSLASISTGVPTLILQYDYSANSDSDPINIAIAAANELITKLWRQEDTPLLAGYEVVWTQKFFQPIYLNPGSYIEDPRDWVPSYFMNPHASAGLPRGDQNSYGPVGPPSTNNSDNYGAGGVSAPSIFDYLTYINPQCYATNGIQGGPLGLSSLRKSDSYVYERTWFSVRHSWLVAPIGKWDADIYSQNNRPIVASQYNQYPNSFS